MPESNEMMSVEGQLVGMSLAGPQSFSNEELNYLKGALDVDETVLWTNSTLSASATLSEPLTNFEFIEIYTRSADNGYQSFKYTAVEGPVNLTYFKGNNYPVMIMAKLTFSGNTVTVSRTLGLAYTWGSTNIPSVARANNNDDKNILIKIVGIHRISGGN